MLNFLRDTDEHHPLDLDTAFDLGNPDHRTAAYADYLDACREGWIKSRRGYSEHKCWISDEGLKALIALASSRRKKK